MVEDENTPRAPQWRHTNDPVLIQVYLQYMDAVRGASPLTLIGYRYMLLRFSRFILQHREQFPQKVCFLHHLNSNDLIGINTQTLAQVNIQEIHAYLSFCRNEQGNKESTRALIVTCLRSFFSYLVNKAKKFTKNPVKNLESPKKPIHQPRYLRLEECFRLMDAIRGREYERDFAIITLFLNTGMRMSELLGINCSDIRDNCITILGKGNKERTIYLNTACQAALDAYLKVRPNHTICGTNALFLYKKKRRIQCKEVNCLIKWHLAGAGIDVELGTAVMLRHTAATLMYKYGKVDIRALQEILGHTNIETTMIYTHLDEQTLQDAMDRNPLSHDLPPICPTDDK